MTTIVHCSHMDIFQNLIVDLDHEGRYLFLNAVANQLRYPNSHTHYFSCTLLYLFVEANSEAIQVSLAAVLSDFWAPTIFYCSHDAFAFTFSIHTGANYTCSTWTSHCKPSTPMGFANHIHRTHQESDLQILGPRFCPLCTRNWEVCEKQNSVSSDFDTNVKCCFVLSVQALWISGQIVYGGENGCRTTAKCWRRIARVQLKSQQLEGFNHSSETYMLNRQTNKKEKKFNGWQNQQQHEQIDRKTKKTRQRQKPTSSEKRKQERNH